jgi:hypothetical protein
MSPAGNSWVFIPHIQEIATMAKRYGIVSTLTLDQLKLYVNGLIRGYRSAQRWGT